MSILILFAIILSFYWLLTIIISKTEELDLKSNQKKLNEQIDFQPTIKDEYFHEYDEYYEPRSTGNEDDEDDEPRSTENEDDEDYDYEHEDYDDYEYEDDEPRSTENEYDEREGYGICELDECGRNIWEDEG